MAGPTVQADADLACVVFGAPFDVTTDRRRLIAGKTFTLRAGELLHIGGTPAGMRGYLCVRGGLQGPLVLGSMSSLSSLTAGTELGCESHTIEVRFLRSAFTWNTEPQVLRMLPGAQSEWFPGDALTGRELTVTPASNRMGLRLQGEPLPVSGREMVSEPVCPGTVQVTRDGQCIVLGVDGQTIGGYPKIGHVIAADLDKVGQLRPGERVSFRVVTLEEAAEIRRAKQTELGQWLTRLRVGSRI